MNFEKIWFSIKSIGTIAVIIGCFIVVMPLAAKVMGLLEKKEELYNEQMIKLTEGVVSKRVELSEKLLLEQIEGLHDEVKQLLDSRDQTVVQVGKIVAELKQDMSEQIGFSHIDRDDPQKSYVETVIKKQMADGEEIPWAWAMFSPNVGPEEKPWTTGSYPVKIHTKIAIGESEDRSDAYIEAWMTSAIFKGDKGKKFPIDVSSVEWVIKPPKEKSFMFNPRFSLGMNLGTELYPSIEASFFSYGKTKGDMDWRFLGIGFGMDSDNRYLHLTPIEYNIGKPLPFAENLFFAPFIAMDQESNTVWGASIQIPF